jgi:hypothetical protein
MLAKAKSFVDRAVEGSIVLLVLFIRRQQQEEEGFLKRLVPALVLLGQCSSGFSAEKDWAIYRVHRV